MDNYTKFPNDILNALISSRLSALRFAIILYIVRKTNGWSKPSDAISVSKMAKEIGYSRRKVVGAVSDLEKMGILSVERNGSGKLSEMSVNSPDKWEQPVTLWSHVTAGSQGLIGHRGVTSGSQVGVTVGSQVPVTSGSHTKERKEIYKDTSQKKEPPAPLFLTEEEAREMFPAEEGWS